MQKSRGSQASGSHAYVCVTFCAGSSKLRARAAPALAVHFFELTLRWLLVAEVFALVLNGGMGQRGVSLLSNLEIKDRLSMELMVFILNFDFTLK